jgi:CheY-like chemotaxis protein
MELHVPTLLVLEHEEDNAMLFSLAARRAHPGLDVRRVTDGQQARAYLTRQPPFEDGRRNPRPDLFVLDLATAQAEGLAVLEWLREQPELAPLQRVAVVGHEDPGDPEAALTLGVAAVFRRAADIGQLDDQVKRIVRAWIRPGDMVAAHLWAAG